VEELQGLQSSLEHWAALWGVTGLEERLTITFSRRLRSSLGRCSPVNGEVRLAAFLLDSPRELLDEVVCHEAAHAAVYELHGRRVKPHGHEWKGLMQGAGYEPKARIKFADLPQAVRVTTDRRMFWEHRCPVCQARRIARRPVRAWRCAACFTAGLDGVLIITRLEGLV